MDIDIARAIGAVRREVRQTEREGRAVRAVIAHRTYDTTIEDMWDAISNPERIPRWFLPVTGDLREGGRYQLEGNAGGTIQSCVPPRRLSVTWEFGGGMSWVEVRLSEEAAGVTRLELEHAAEPDAHWEAYGSGATGVGWELALVGLAEHLSSAAAVDPKDAADWTASEAGKTFIRRSSDGWADASIAGGEATEETRAAAARTTAFYTGDAAEPTDDGRADG